MSANDEIQALSELRETIGVAAELLAAFIAAAADGAELAPKLVDSAHQTCDDLGSWRATLTTITQQHGDRYATH